MCLLATCWKLMSSWDGPLFAVEVNGGDLKVPRVEGDMWTSMVPLLRAGRTLHFDEAGQGFTLSRSVCLQGRLFVSIPGPVFQGLPRFCVEFCCCLPTWFSFMSLFCTIGQLLQQSGRWPLTPVFLSMRSGCSIRSCCKCFLSGQLSLFPSEIAEPVQSLASAVCAGGRAWQLWEKVRLCRG